MQTMEKKKIELFDTATVIEIYGDGEAYEMEFFDKEGKTIGVYTVSVVIT